jgi:hypothetical protein
MRQALVLAGLLASAATLAHAADYRAPRTAYGAPELEGLWSSSSLTEFERPKEFKTLVAPEAEAAAYEKAHRGKPPVNPEDKIGAADSEWWELDVGLARIRGQIRTSWIVSPADGQVPFTETAQAANKARSERFKTNFDNPESRGLSERCLDPEAAGPPLINGGYADFLQIVQTRDTIALMGEYDHTYRLVRLGGERHPPANVRRWGGDSIGRWEGQTLVVETTNFTAAEVNDPAGDPKSDMRVVERFTRISPSEILYEYIDDEPSRFIQSVRGEMVLNASKAPIYEFACHEGNYALANILAGGRQQDAAPPAAIAKAAP